MPQRQFNAALVRRGCITQYLAPAEPIDGVPTVAGCVDVARPIQRRMARVPGHCVVNSGDQLLAFVSRLDADAFAASRGVDLTKRRRTCAYRRVNQPEWLNSRFNRHSNAAKRCAN